MGKITFIPVGGLANRMRAIASALYLSKKAHASLNVVWIKDWALNAPFNELFLPLDIDSFAIKDANMADKLLFDRPRKKNLYYTRLFQMCYFHSSLYEDSVASLCKQGFDFSSWAIDNENVYLSSYTNFMEYEEQIISKLFVPKDDIKAEIENYVSKFNNDTIGLHIRRTDNAASIKQSPIELFYDKIDNEIKLNERTSFFLATDSEIVKEDMQRRYGDRILFSRNAAVRDSVQGIKGGVAEMFVLSRTKKIYGSFRSSFSEMAAQISGIPLEILKL